MGYKSYSHSSYSSRAGGYSKTHVSGAGNKSQGSGYHYSSYYSTSSSKKEPAHIERSTYVKGNTTYRTTSGADGKGNSFYYRGSYTRYK